MAMIVYRSVLVLQIQAIKTICSRRTPSFRSQAPFLRRRGPAWMSRKGSDRINGDRINGLNFPKEYPIYKVK